MYKVPYGKGLMLRLAETMLHSLTNYTIRMKASLAKQRIDNCKQVHQYVHILCPCPNGD